MAGGTARRGADAMAGGGTSRRRQGDAGAGSGVRERPGRSAGLHSRAYVAEPGSGARERGGGERAGNAGREHDPAAHCAGAGARPGMAVGTRGRRAESRRRCERRRTVRGGGPAAAAGDPRSSGSHGRAWLQARPRRRALGIRHREGLCRVSARCRHAARRSADAGCPACDAGDRQGSETGENERYRQHRNDLNEQGVRGHVPTNEEEHARGTINRRPLRGMR